MATSPNATMTAKASENRPEQAAIDALQKAYKKEYIAASNFPEWTKGQQSINEPLTLPERKKNRLAEDGLDEEVRCLFCDQTHVVPANQEGFVAHLVQEHHFLIDRPETVADLAGYVNYWRKKFEQKPITEYCSVLTSKVTSKDKDEEKEVDFYMLSDQFQEDKELRIHLQRRRLEEILDYHRLEREDKSFRRDCLFCRTSFEEDYAKLLNHMAFDHNFSVGKPDNIVFVRELLDLLDKRLTDNVCIYCEKVFKSREVLKEHMRKKGHKKINPKNASYDKFYIVNYQELDRKWEEIARDNFSDDDELPTGFESDDSDSECAEDNRWGDWVGEQRSAVCLFCPAMYGEINDLLTHMTSIHDFDFQHVRNTLKLSYYRQVKLINYIRRHVHLRKCIFCREEFKTKESFDKHMATESHMKVPEESSDTWDQTEYYFPTYENDELLYMLDDDLYGKDEKAPVEGEDPAVKPEDSVLNDPELIESITPAGGPRGKRRSGPRKQN